MKKIVVDMQNFLFADSIATAFKNSDYDIAVVRAESPRDTIELCRVFKPFVLLMEVTAYDEKIVLDIRSCIHAHTMERMLMQKLDDC